MATTETKQVYILGNKQGVEQCMSNLTGLTPYLGDDVWIVSENASIGNDDPSMENLKENDMDCDDDANVSSDREKRPHMASTEASVNMKRLKSLGSSSESNASYSHVDVGYESDNTETSGIEMIAHMNAIVLEDDSGLHNKIASFLIRLITLPALFILAVDSEHFDHEFYVNLIKELSVLASMKGDKISKLLMVGIDHKCTVKVHEGANEQMERRDKLHCGIMKTHFGYNFDWCDIDNMRSTLMQVMNGMGWRFCTGTVKRKALSTLFKGKYFIETKMVKETHLEFVNQNFTFTSNNIEYMCRPKDLMNEFVRALKKQARYKLKMEEFMKQIDVTVVTDRPMFIDAFTEVGLINTDTLGLDETVNIMPLVCSKNIPVFDEIERSVNTSILKLTVELDIIPVFVKANIFKLLTTVHKWTLQSSGPSRCGLTDAYYFVKESLGLLMLCGFSTKTTSYICLYGYGNRNHSDDNSNREYESLRQGVECELRSWKSNDKRAKRFICYQIKQNDTKDKTDILQTTGNDWTELDLEKMESFVDDGVFKSLIPWFFSKANEIEKDMRKKTSDAFLADVADLIGNGGRLFFISEDIPAEQVDQMRLDNPFNIKEATLQMLLEWRKQKGTKGNMMTLRSAFKNSSHVTVDLNKFDKFVKELFRRKT